MSRYTSSRYDSTASTATAAGAASTGSHYKSSSLDAGGLGSYRSSNLTGYGLHHDHGSSGRRGSGFGGSSAGSGSSGVGGSLSSSSGSSSTTRGLSYPTSSSVRSSTAGDNGGVSLPRSSSFRPSEVLSSSTPRDHVTSKGTYSSGLGRSTSLPSEQHSHRIYGTSKATTTGTTTSSLSVDTGVDSARERRLLRAAQRRQRLREDAGGVGGAPYFSETSSGDNTSKEPSVERASSLRRDSDPDTAATSGGSSRRWTSGRMIRESSLTEESEGKESSPDVGTVETRRARRLRNTNGSGSGSEDLTSAALTRAASALDSVAKTETESALEKSTEARKARRQKRLEEAGRQNSGEVGGGGGGESAPSVTSSSWRQRLHEQGVTGILHEDGSSTQTQTRRRSRDDVVAPLGQVDEEKTTFHSREAHREEGGDVITARRRSRDNGADPGVSRRRSLRSEVSEVTSAEEAAKAADAVAAEVETRAERIARYKEERRKQLAHIASITSPAEVNEPVAPLPSLFTSAKRDKEDSPPCGGGGGGGDGDSNSSSAGNGVGKTHSEDSENGDGPSTSLMTRLRALRSGSAEQDSVNVADTQNKVADAEVNAKHAQPDKAESGFERSDASNATHHSDAVQSSQSSFSKATESSRLRKSPSPASTRKPLTTSTGTTSTATARKASVGSRESSTKKPSVSADSKSAAAKPEETRKSKSPSPVSSRLMSATRSSAAKGTAATAAAANRGSTSPRSSPSRSSPGPSLARSASAASSTSSRDAPKIKQTLMPERGSRSAASTTSSRSVDGEKEASTKQSGSKYMVRLPTNQPAADGGEGTHALREKESPPKTGSTAAPKLSSSSYSAGSSFRSTDRDSGFGSSRPSSSSFSFSRSPEKDVVDTPAASSSSSTAASSSSKVPKLRRTARVEVSSSSSREGSEEKQIPATSPTSKTASSLKRASSLPSKTSAGAGSYAKTPGFSTIREQQQQQQQLQSSRSQGSRERRFSSSSPEKEPSPPKDLSLSTRAGSSSATRTQATARESEDKESKDQRKAKVGPHGTSSGAAAVTSPGSSGGGLDDILAKNAEFLSSDEEDTGSDTVGALGGKGEPRKLRPKEEPKLRRSLRRKVVHRSGSRDSPARDSKSDGSREGTVEKEIKEVPADVTITLPTTTIKLEEGGLICPSPCISPPTTATTSAPTATTTAAAAADKRNKDDGGSTVIFVSDVVEASTDAVLTSTATSHDATRTSTTASHDATRTSSSTTTSQDATLPSSSTSQDATLTSSSTTAHDVIEAGSHHDVEKTKDAGTTKKKDVNDCNVTTELPAADGGGTGGGGGDGSSSSVKAGERKERTPDSDGVFETASDSSASAGTSSTQTARATHRRRREDRSELRKSSMNKADESQDGSSHFSGRDGTERGDQEVSDIRSRFSGGGEDKNKHGGAGATTAGDKSPSLTRHPSRGKEFSQLLHKFSSTSEASSSERSDSDSGHGHGHSHVRRELTPPTSSAFRRHEPREAGANSSSDESTRRTPERTQSLKVVRSSAKEEAATKDSASGAAGSSLSTSSGVERSGSFKSDFMKKRFSPVPREDGPSDELSAVLSRRQKEVDVQQREDDDKRGDKRQAKAEHFKTVGVDEVIADNEVAAVLKARRKEMDSKLEVFVSEEKESSPEAGDSRSSVDRNDRAGSRGGDQTSSSGSSLQRAESLKEQSSVKRSESFERRKGILKRTPSIPKQHEAQAVLDPKLAKIMEQRRQKELEMEIAAKELDEDEVIRAAAGARPRSKSAAEEIGESVRLMREAKQSKTEGTEANAQNEEEAMLCRSVADRINVMQTKIVEGNAPKPRSGATTPKSTRSWSGSITPRRQISVDEGVAGVIPEEDTPTTTTAEPETVTTSTTTTTTTTGSNEEVSGEQLMEKLNTLAAKSADFQQRRHKFQKRQREDWRTRTQPITLEEIHQADRLTLAEKVKLFSKKQKEEQEAANAVPPPRADAPVPRRRQRKLQASRFNTQPVTPEELAKASKISPLAMSLVKPPDPEMLIGLKLKDQQELMMMHAEATLSQCSSRSGSRPSSRSGSFSTPASLQQAEADLKESEETPSTQQSTTATTTTTTAATTSAKKSRNELTRTDSERRSILKKTKSTENVPSVIASVNTDTATIANTISNTNTAPSPTTYAPPSSSSSTTAVTADEDKSSKDESAQPKEREAEKTSVEQEQEGGDRASPVAELILPVVEAETDAASTVFFLSDEGIGGESTTDPVEGEKAEEEEEAAAAEKGEEAEGAGEEEGGREAGEEEEDESSRSTKAKDSKRRSRFTDRKAQAERYLTQPAPQLIQEKSPTPKRKYEGRHMTQPITPDEMKEAESAFIPPSKSGGSIADRLNQLKTSGEEGWKRKVVKDDSPIRDIKLREGKGLAAVRPVSISDRLSKLEESSGQWKGRVEETDAKHFTVANKISKTGAGSESPLVAKILASSKKDLSKLDDSSNASSPVNSPSTPTKEFLPKVPLPKEIVADPVAVKKAEERKVQEKKQQDLSNDKKEESEAVRVEVPTVDQTEIEQFFATKEITEIVDKVDMDVDDFNDIFVEANEILPAVRKIRATRKKKATSRNPLKTVSQFVELQTEYIQVKTGAAEKHQRLLKTEGIKRDAGFAVEALAGLASKENFSQVELRKTEPSSLPAALAMRQNPFCDLMLLHVKGRRNVQVRLVEPSAKSMNSGDCFLLVTPDKLIYWIGEFSNIIEKAKAAEVATFIQKKRDLGYKGTQGVQNVEQAKDHLGAGKHFWAALSGQKECQACGPDTEDELYESCITNTNMVYRLIDGALRPYEEYWGALPRHEMLDKKEVLVFDFGAEFYVWQGKGVSSEKRKQGMALAQKLWDKGYNYSECAINPMAPLRAEEEGGISVQASQRPPWAIFGKINQNMETILFQEKFADWPDASRLIVVKQPHSTSQAKNELADIKAYDAKKMVPVNDSPVTLMLEGAHVGRGKKWQEDMQGFIKEQDILTLGIKVWHVLEYDHYEMPEASYGQFHQGDTYVVRWQYMITNAGLRSLKGQAARHSLTGRERCAYFFWQGQNSTINEKGASALMTVELDEERGPQVRVVHEKEPPCFVNLFEGSMIVHIGKREDSSTNTVGPWRQYCLRGDDPGEVCLLEMPISISNLRSHSSLIMLNTRTGITYVWHGIKSPKHVRQLAVNATKIIKEKRPLELDLHKDAHIIITEVEEGEEKAEIWSALDSKDRTLYHSMLTLRDPVKLDYTPRLFYMTSVSMVFEVTEQLNPTRLPGVTSPFPFFQSDLYKASQPALFLLDVGRCVYLWQGWWPIGNEEVENVHTGSATARYNTDRRCAMETTLNYCKEMSSGSRTPEAYLVCAGVEPLEFQNLFPFWEPDETVCNLTLQEGKQKEYCERVEDVYTKLTQTRYTLEQLQERPLPEGVDPLKLEKYLPDEEFEEVMDMKREEFYTLPAWKQNQLKQYLGLF